MGRALPWSLSDADRGVNLNSEDGGERVDAPAFDVYRDTAGQCVSCTPYSCHRDNFAGDSRLTGPEDRTMSDSYEFATHRSRSRHSCGRRPSRENRSDVP